jgi:hypothetical protein
MKLSDLAILNEQFPDNCGRRETIRLDQQSRLLKESKSPQTGIYWWVPVKDSWRLESFFDSEYGQAYHKEVWELYAATILGIDNAEVPQDVREAYHGLPRGRISKHKGDRYLILHGSDSPVDDFKTVVMSRFHLLPNRTAASYDSHEIMLDDEAEIIKNFIAQNRDY